MCDRPPDYAADGGPVTPEDPPLDHYPPPCITLVSASTSSNSSLSSAASSAESKAASVVLESEEEAAAPATGDSSGYLADSLGDSQQLPPLPLAAEKPKKKKKRVSEADKVQAELALESSQDPDEWHPDRKAIPPELLLCLRPMIRDKKSDPDYQWLFFDSLPLNKPLSELSFVDMSSAMDTGISREKRRKIAGAKRRAGANFLVHEICTGLKLFVKRYLLEKDGKSHGENEWNVAIYLRNALKVIDFGAFRDPPVMVPIDYIRGPEAVDKEDYVYGYVIYNYEPVITLSDLTEKTKADRGYPTRLQTLQGLKDIASLYALLDGREGGGVFTHNELHPGQVLFLKHNGRFQLGDLSHASIVGREFDIGPPKMIAGSSSTEWRELFSMFLKSGLVRRQDRALVQDCMRDADRMRALEKLGGHMKRIESEKEKKEGAEDEEITSV